MTPRSEEPSPAEYRAAGELRASLRRFARSSELALRAAGLTQERYELLLAIKAEDPRATVGRLAEALDVAQSSVTQLVRRAEDAGLLHREVSSADARVRYLRITTQGERSLARAVTALRSERATLSEIVPRLADPRVERQRRL